MASASRQFYIWLISLAAVLAIYLLYSQLSKTPKIDIDTRTESADIVADTNISESDRSTGRIGDVGVGAVRKARYVRLNNKKQIEREFGFEKLLHEEGDEWELEKPYMNIYRPNYKCFLTADKGTVQIEDTVGKPRPRDATLSGNVVIHIVPENSGSIKESFIYLDEVIFISEKSQFSTAGPVKFASKDAQLLGRGLELVYNNELDRLEFLRIIHLESLHLKTSPKASLFATDPIETGTTNNSSYGQKHKPPKPVASTELLIAKPMLAANSTLRNPAKHSTTQKGETPNRQSDQAIDEEKGEYYRCVFSKNVLIDCPEQLILADELSINNILWSKASDTKPPEKDADSKDSEKTTGKVSEETITATESKTDTNIVETTEKSTGELPEEFVSIVVTCDNGIVATPMDTPIASESSTKPIGINSFDNTSGRTTFIAQKIDYCAATENTVANGPSELTFYAKNITGSETKETPAMVKVTAQKQAKFTPALNQAIFEGRCLCTMLQDDTNYQLKYTLSAPKLTINLSTEKRKSDSATNIEHLTASGGAVKLATLKTTVNELLGGIELKCSKFDYDTTKQECLATGPGLIKADNSNIPEPEAELGRFSLRQRCYAVMQNFDTLKYFLQTNQIIADANHEAIFINYFPIIQDQYGQQVAVTSKHIEAVLYESPSGRTELSMLKATGGFTYEEASDKTKKKAQPNDIQFVGSEMFYDANKALMTVHGDELQPCYFNGALVDAVEYDLKTGKIKTKITAPSILQMNLR
ncbi:MAG: hypothetical protein JSV82_02825 [Planctomycetota bacterium]|nr:MAG: hypothetical protein JSV82_02825 [Planctomycetota bacterium]